jgi:hypothetical protein
LCPSSPPTAQASCFEGRVHATGVQLRGVAAVGPHASEQTG